MHFHEIDNRAINATIVLGAVGMLTSTQMDEHLRTVEESKECFNDEVFAAQVRLQLLLHRSYQMRDLEGEASQRSKMLPGLCLKALQSQLQDIKASIDCRLQQNCKL